MIGFVLTFLMGFFVGFVLNDYIGDNSLVVRMIQKFRDKLGV